MFVDKKDLVEYLTKHKFNSRVEIVELQYFKVTKRNGSVWEINMLELEDYLHSIIIDEKLYISVIPMIKYMAHLVTKVEDNSYLKHHSPMFVGDTEIEARGLLDAWLKDCRDKLKGTELTPLPSAPEVEKTDENKKGSN